MRLAEKVLYCRISIHLSSKMKKRTLLIGLGGTGGQILRAWRQAMATSGMPPVSEEVA